MRSDSMNADVNEFRPKRTRLYIIEYVADKAMSLLPMLQRRYAPVEGGSDGKNANVTDGKVRNSFTLLTRWSGRVGLGSISPITFPNYPAIKEALRSNSIVMDQASGAITISNIPILALPMVMSLIPVSFVAEMNTLATLVFIIFTILFSIIPYMIKGLEPVLTGNNKDSTLVLHVIDDNFGQMEIFWAKRHGKEKFRE